MKRTVRSLQEIRDLIVLGVEVFDLCNKPPLLVDLEKWDYWAARYADSLTEWVDRGDYYILEE